MIKITDNFRVNKPAPIDDRLGPFASTALALSSIELDRRYIGLTVIVDDGTGAVDYWFKDGVTNGDLEAKSTGGGGGGVPYTGATQNVDLGTYNLTADQVNLNVNPTGTLAVGGTQWNDTIGSSETLLKGGSVTLKNGVDLVARVVNKVNPNTTLTKASYQVVKVSGAQGQRLAVELARANNDLNSADTLGVVIETIAANQEGFIMTVGQLEGINTTGSLQGETWEDGDVLYLSPTTAGQITNVKPNGLTGHIVVIGYVEYKHANNGKIYVKVMNGWELAELHDVYINPATLANNDALLYDSTAQLWENTPLTKSLVGLGNVDNTSDANKPISTATQTALNGKENTITAGTTAQYYRGDKTFQTLDKTAVGLGNVDNTADANKQFTASQITSGTFDKARLPKVRPAVSIASSAGISGNTTSEVILQTLTIPANTLSVGDVIRIFGLYSYTTTGTKLPRLKFGSTTAGTAILAPPGAIGATITSTQVDLIAIVTSTTNLRFMVNNATNALIYGTNTGALTNVSINLGVSNSFIFTIQKNTGTDTAVCETAYLEIITT